MCATPEQTLTSLWASLSTLNPSTPQYSPRHPSCWDWERLTNRYSAPWQVCATKMMDILNEPVCTACLKHASVKPFAELREAGVDCLTLGQYMQPTKRHLKVRIWTGFAGLKMTAGSETCVLAQGGGVCHPRKVCPLGENGEWFGLCLHCQRATGAILLQSRWANRFKFEHYSLNGQIGGSLFGEKN